jgi:hypothetical protein
MQQSCPHFHPPALGVPEAKESGMPVGKEAAFKDDQGGLEWVMEDEIC